MPDARTPRRDDRLKRVKAPPPPPPLPPPSSPPHAPRPPAGPSGGGRLARTFARLANAGRKAFIPFVPGGFPRLQDTPAVLDALARSGADIIELGIPFSDSLADGPVIQRAYHQAIAAGVTTRDLLAQVREFRQDHQTPLVLMVGYNLVHRYGLSSFAVDCQAIGVDGLIVPDLPHEESGPLRELLRPTAGAICLISLLAPTTPLSRALAIARHSSGFIYYISRKGITGTGGGVDPHLARRLGTLRARLRLPLVVGFGIATPEQACTVGALADGVVMGSALVEIMAAHPAGEFLEPLAAHTRAVRVALDGSQGRS